MSNNDISKRNVVSKTHTTQPIFSEAKLCMWVLIGVRFT
jgi:hypothetical protein